MLFIHYFITPSLLCFVILVLLYYLGSRPHAVTATDDIYYWTADHMEDEWLDVLTPYRVARKGEVPFLESEWSW